MAKNLMLFSIASPKASISSMVLYKYKLAREVAPIPTWSPCDNTLISGFAQWCPARTHTPDSSSI